MGEKDERETTNTKICLKNHMKIYYYRNYVHNLNGIIIKWERQCLN